MFSIFKLHEARHEASIQWEGLYFRRAILADMRRLTSFSMRYGGKTHIFANPAGYAIPSSQTGRVVSAADTANGNNSTRGVYLLGVFREGEPHPAVIVAAMVFTTCNDVQRLPALIELTVHPIYRQHTPIWAEQIMIITLRDFAKRCRNERRLSWVDIGEFVNPWVRFGVQVSEPRIFGTLWKELLTSVDDIGPVLDDIPAGESDLSLSSVPSSPTDYDPSPHVSVRSRDVPGRARSVSLTSSEGSFGYNRAEHSGKEAYSNPNVVGLPEPLPTLEPTASPGEVVLKLIPDFGVGWLASGESRSRRRESRLKLESSAYKEIL